MRLQIKVLALLVLPLLAVAGTAQTVQAEARAYFAPDGGVKEAVIDHINHAKQSIHILSYYFSEPGIARALTDAAKRGVKVEAIFDSKAKSRDKNPFLAGEIKKVGAAVYLDSRHNLMHNKVIIYDGSTVQTGSYNLRKKTDETNAENVIFITSKSVSEEYMNNFQTHKKHSQSY